ncbi:MAG: hypothetical protein ISS15_13970 [Alphaproteobacteria bacterium]|nr:hypothetical protein [Alphaproteobacteria bacterium]MBL7098761.1 hypothetical protein [Alphaproteobacteria bacterium]
MTKARMILAAVPFVFGCAAPSTGEVPAPPRAVSCDIRATPISGVLRLEGIVHAAPGTTGSYRFMLEKDGPSGSSKVGQGGDFVVPVSGETIVTHTDFNVGKADTYRADMRVTVAGDANSCTAAKASD